MERRERQPPAFYLLLVVAALERSAYYGLRSVLFMVFLHRLELGTKVATAIFETMAIALLLGPLAAGAVADRFLGQQKAVIAGGILTALGVVTLLQGDFPYFAMGLVVCGTSLFRPALPSLLGDLYRRGDPRRDAGFMLLSMTIGVGGLVGLVVTGIGAAGTDGALAVVAVMSLMTVGIFMAGQRLLRAEGYPGSAAEAPAARLTRKDLRSIASICVAAVIFALIAVALWPELQPGWKGLPGEVQAIAILNLIGIAVVIDRVLSRGTRYAWTSVERQRIGVLGILLLYSVLVWVGQELAIEPMQQAALRKDLGMSAARFVSLLYLVPPVVLAPLLAVLWRRVDDSPHRISGVAKLGIGGIVTGFAMGIAWLAGEHAGVGLLVLISVLAAAGGLLVGTIGMSMVTQLAPHRSLSFMMAVWMAGPAMASYCMAGYLVESREGVAGDSSASAIGAVLVLGMGVALWRVTPFIKKWMHGADDAWRPDRPGADLYRAGGDVVAGEAPARLVAGGVEGAGGAPFEQVDTHVHTRRMIVGALWAGGGLAVTLASMNAAGGGRFVIAYGAIIYGVVLFFRGLIGSASDRKG